MLTILNLKTHFNYKEILKYEKKLRKYNCIVLPSSCYLSVFQNGKYFLGSQDISEYNDSYKTGEITASQLKSLNVSYSLIGHIERRKYNNESNETIINKITNCINNDIIPLYCIGSESDNIDELKDQIDLYLNNFKETLYLIYEPINNIGKKEIDILKISSNINKIKNYINTKTNNYKLIYGGGINKDNVKTLINNVNIDGIILSTSSFNMNNIKYFL